MNVGLYKDSDKGRWDEYVRSSEGACLYHLSAWGELIRGCFGHDTYYLYTEEGGSITGVLPMVHLKSRLFGSFLVSMPYFNYGGICAKSLEARDALLKRAVEMAKETGAGHIELRETAQESGSLPVKTNKVLMRLTLPSSGEELWRKLPNSLLSCSDLDALAELCESALNGAERTVMVPSGQDTREACHNN